MGFDGASRVNPGLSGSGALIRDSEKEGKVVKEVCVELVETTNNVAECSALIEGLKALKEMGVRHVLAKGDSTLVIK